MTFVRNSLSACLFALLVVVPTFAAEVEVKLLGGRESVQGELTSLGTTINVVTADEKASLPTRDVLSVEFDTVEPGEKPSVWVELLDGSLLNAVQVGAQSGKATVEVIGGVKVEVPARSLRSVRFRSQDAALARQWRDIGSAMAGGDVLVIRKTSERTIEEFGAEPKTVTETALDQLEGAVLGITPDKVQFDFDGEKVDVRRDKVEGIFFYSSVQRELPSPLCKLIDAGGSQWSLRSVELREAGVAGVSTAGVSLVVPLDQVRRIDFSAGNVLFLGDAEPDNLELAVALQPSEMQAKFTRLYDSWQNGRFGARTLSLGGVKYEKGLGLASRSEVSYRVPEGFQHFRAVAGLDDNVEQTGGVKLTILGDNKPLYTRDFTSAERGPVMIDFAVGTARRLTIVVAPLAGQGFGDLLNLCEARLTK